MEQSVALLDQQGVKHVLESKSDVTWKRLAGIYPGTRLVLISAHFTGVNNGKSDSLIWIIVGVVVGAVAVTAAV